MLQVVRHSTFKKDYKRIKRRGCDVEKLRGIITLLANKEQLPRKYKNHKLVGDWAGRMECHIQSDWLLLYRYTETELILERTGTHSDLFKS